TSGWKASPPAETAPSAPPTATAPPASKPPASPAQSSSTGDRTTTRAKGKGQRAKGTGTQREEGKGKGNREAGPSASPRATITLWRSHRRFGPRHIADRGPRRKPKDRRSVQPERSVTVQTDYIGDTSQQLEGACWRTRLYPLRRPCHDGVNRNVCRSMRPSSRCMNRTSQSPRSVSASPTTSRRIASLTNTSCPCHLIWPLGRTRRTWCVASYHGSTSVEG